ncbi:hypothetical protein A9S00_23350 [Salmonella enterica subsp. enterica serovar Heidelberg]|nr:hypothetical protein [Salmonella enterica subsp. enterica serovar Heidelberg]
MSKRQVSTTWAWVAKVIKNRTIVKSKNFLPDGATLIRPTVCASCRPDKAFTPPSGNAVSNLRITLPPPPSAQQRATHHQQSPTPDPAHAGLHV